EGFGSWWPLKTHKLGAQAAKTAIIEPRLGGRWFERKLDGSECDWGRVLVWEPPERLVLSWEISSDWLPDTTVHTEVEIRFIADGPNTTTVQLEHRNLDQYAGKTEMMRSIFDSEGGWGGILQRFVNLAGGAGLGDESPCPAQH